MTCLAAHRVQVGPTAGQCIAGAHSADDMNRCLKTAVK
jgi:hypothetical protein